MEHVTDHSGISREHGADHSHANMEHCTDNHASKENSINYRCASMEHGADHGGATMERVTHQVLLGVIMVLTTVVLA